MQLMFEPPAKQHTVFDLTDAILPAIIMTSALGSSFARPCRPAHVCERVTAELTAQVVLALLDNARVHARYRGRYPRHITTKGSRRSTSKIVASAFQLRPANRHSSVVTVAPKVPVPDSVCTSPDDFMEEQGGSLTVARRPGGGSSFGLHLPTATGRIVRGASSGRTTAHGSRAMRGRVLVVDDHVLVAIGSQLSLASAWLGSGDVQRTDRTRRGGSRRTLPAAMHPARHQHRRRCRQRHRSDCTPVVDRDADRHADRRTATPRSRRVHRSGAAGWIRKNAEIEEVESTVACVVNGGTLIGRADRAALIDDLRLERAGRLRALATFDRLSKREALVLGELIDGRSAEEIAEVHFVALTTVRSQIRRSLQKLGVRSQLAAVRARRCSP